MDKSVKSDEVIEFEWGTITQAKADNFSKAIRAKHISGISPTFPTLFRKPEFDWLDRLHISLESLLHTEQEYLFYRSPRVGDVIKVRTHLAEFKERSGKAGLMIFVVLESDVFAHEEKILKAITTFVVRTKATEKSL